jgi:RHS repeat-associated protein
VISSAGNVQERYVYDPYGKVTYLTSTWGSRSSSSYAWVYLHQGGRLDTTSGLYHLRNRDYSPLLGRWVQRDPLEYLARDTNLYRYTSNSAVTYTDPTGLLKFRVSTIDCRVTLIVKVKFVWKDSATSTWTVARQVAFKTAFERRVEAAWNGSGLKIYPLKKEYVVGCELTLAERRCIKRKCPCQNGWTPMLDVQIVTSGHDFKIQVLANPPPAVFIQSEAHVGGTLIGTDAYLDEDDVNWILKPSGNWQIPAVHEFGHLLGLEHPGTPGAPDEYTADAPSLMGEGMRMRPYYYNKWVDQLPDYCGPYVVM